MLGCPDPSATQAFGAGAVSSISNPTHSLAPLPSIQGGLGEASCLALSARYGSDRGPITLWSSGTGFAGVAGYAWVAALHVWAGLSFRTTLLAGNVLAGAWLATFFLLLRPPPPRPVPLPTSDGEEDDDTAASAGPAPIDPERVPLRPAAAGGLLPRSGSRSALAVEAGGSHAATGRGAGAGPGKPKPGGRTAAALSIQERRPAGAGRGGETGPGAAASLPPSALGPLGRLCLTLGLWPFTVPLFTVYLAEYSMQSGAWTAIGGPVVSEGYGTVQGLLVLFISLSVCCRRVQGAWTLFAGRMPVEGLASPALRVSRPEAEIRTPCTTHSPPLLPTIRFPCDGRCGPPRLLHLRQLVLPGRRFCEPVQRHGVAAGHGSAVGHAGLAGGPPLLLPARCRGALVVRLDAPPPLLSHRWVCEVCVG